MLVNLLDLEFGLISCFPFVRWTCGYGRLLWIGAYLFALRLILSGIHKWLIGNPVPSGA